MPKIFPENGSENLAIGVSGVGARSGFSVLMVKTLPELQVIDNGQFFPLWIYEEKKASINDSQSNLFDTVKNNRYVRKDGITDFALNNFKSTLSIEKISKEEIFFYTYAVLHSEKYRRDLSNHLSKELPRIPIPSSSESFESYVRAGRSLATLHVDYENVSLYSCRIEYTDNYERLSQKDLYQLIRMKFINKSERSTVVYNSHIKICDVPLEAYEYVVNGKPALEWVMERQCVKVDKDSGIVNDANDYAIETMDNPAYPLELFQRVVTVSLETMKIVKSLPSLG